MKKALFSLLMGAGTLTAGAQTSGVVSYTETMHLRNLNLEGEDEALKELIPKERKAESVLYFTEQASLYEGKKQEDEQEQEYDNGQARMRIRMDRPEEQYYYDISRQMMTQQREFMGRKFLVEGKKDAAKWKLTGKQRELLGYPCQEAVLEEEGRKVTAWFTPAIPVSTGPAIYAGLPGLVLSVDMGGIQTIEASSVELKAPPADRIRKPKEGKRMTSEEFRDIVREKEKEMGGDGNGNVIIRVRR